MAESHEAGTTVSPGEESFADRRAVVLTPDQRVRVFVSSTREELAEERAAARRAIRRLHLIPVWHEAPGRTRRGTCTGPTWSRARFLSVFTGNGTAGWGRDGDLGSGG
jgi:hypothetical protein